MRPALRLKKDAVRAEVGNAPDPSPGSAVVAGALKTAKAELLSARRVGERVRLCVCVRNPGPD